MRYPDTGQTIRIGDRAFVRKYGAWYSATIIAIGRTTVTVRFTDKGNKNHTSKLPGNTVQYDLREDFR